MGKRAAIANGAGWKDLEDALAQAGDGALTIGEDGRIRAWNGAAEKILGYTAREVVGRPCCEILAGRDDDDNRVCHPGCRVMALVGMGDSVRSFDMRTHRKSGQAVWINISTLAIPGADPRRALTIHLFRDITVAKELLTLMHDRTAALNGLSAGAASALTRRELEVLRLIGAGVKTTDAAGRLHVSRVTVRNHVQNILVKLGVHSRLEAVVYANRHRLL